MSITINDLTDRTEQVMYIARSFMDEKILKNISRVFVSGGKIHIEAEDGYVGDITYPMGSSEEIEP